MSPSDPSTSLCRVVVDASPDTEVFLIDHTFQLAKRAVGRLDVQVPAGLYIVKFRRGTVVREITRVVSPAGPEEIPVPTDLGAAAAPVADLAPPAAPAVAPPAVAPAAAAPTADAPAGAAVAAASRGSAIVLAIEGAKGESEHHPAEGLTLLDAAGDVVAEMSATSRMTSQAGGPTATTLMALEPGAYRLRLVLGQQGMLEQTIVLSPGWQTQVRIDARNYAFPNEAPFWRADVADASVLMLPVGETRVPAEICSYSQLVKAWLAGPQLTIATTHAERLAGSSIADPMFGLCVAHALVRQTEIDRAHGGREPRPRRSLVKKLVAQLQSLIPAHPDVDALAVWLGAKPSVPFATPPMLLSSWSIIAAKSVQRPTLVPAGSLSSRIAEHVWSSPVWLLWRGDLVPSATIAPHRVRRGALLGTLMTHWSPSISEEESGFSDLEREVWHLLGRATKESAAAVGTELMKHVGVPAASFDRALASMVGKLKLS